VPIFKHFDLTALRRDPQIAYYFRYPLYHSDFQAIRANGRLLGYAAAKPLYGRLTAAGQVDRSAGFNGQIAVLFIKSPARSARRAEILLTAVPPAELTRPDGKRNWPVIRAAAEATVRAHVPPPPDRAPEGARPQ
jgi:hypothetical protein